MSINSDMELYVLEAKVRERTESGALKDNWEFVREIYVDVNKIDDLIVSQSALVNQSSHFGLTLDKDIKEGKNRLKKDDEIYTINGCDTKGKYTSLYLKKVDEDV